MDNEAQHIDTTGGNPQSPQQSCQLFADCISDMGCGFNETPSAEVVKKEPDQDKSAMCNPVMEFADTICWQQLSEVKQELKRAACIKIEVKQEEEEDECKLHYEGHVSYEQATQSTDFKVELGKDTGCLDTTEWKSGALTDETGMLVPPYECTECDYTFKNKRNLVRHLKVLHNPDRQLYKCAQCEFESRQKDDLYTHVRIMHSFDSESHKCEACGQSFKEKRSLARHMKVVHNPVRESHKCVQCDFMTSHRDSLLRHVKIMHSFDSESYQCAECDYTTRHKTYLTRHVRLVHDPDTQSHKCAECEFTTKRKYSLTKHTKRIHDSSSRS